MNIESIDGGSLRVWLAEEELRHWGLHTDPPNRRLARRLVRQITAAAGRPTGRLTAELIPVMGGGVLVITDGVITETGQPVVYRLGDEDALLDLMARWPNESPAPLCVLYAVEDAYWLAVYSDSPLSSWQRRLLLEYGVPLGGGEGAVAHAAEYGKVIAADLFTAGAPDLPAP